MELPVKFDEVLLPKKGIDMEKWCVVACDQFTSQPAYWEKLAAFVGDEPSALNLIYPECYLSDKPQERIAKIIDNMNDYLGKDLFRSVDDGLILVERTTAHGNKRYGLMMIVDLTQYSFKPEDKALIRATEGTVIERIPPRVKIRENAPLELPHIMILIDDDKKQIIENLKNKVSEDDIVYDFDLMKNGGHIKGYLLNNETMDEVDERLECLADKDYFENKYGVKDKGILLFAMGDGNHSLATAKACYENLKKEIGEKALSSKSRYALVELVNLHSDALEFEAINRVIFNTDKDKLLNSLKEYYTINKEGNGQEFRVVTDNIDEAWYIENPKSNIAVGSIQMFLDDYLKDNVGKIDYIHGEDVTKSLASKDNNVGFIFDAMAKEDLFKTVILDGALPRKTFSMGHANDKRYYLEARKIK